MICPKCSGKPDGVLTSIKGTVIEVNGNDMVVYEYKTTKKALKDRKNINSDGFGNNTSRVSWAENPHFFYKDKIIVQYIGNNMMILKHLMSKLETVAGNTTDYYTYRFLKKPPTDEILNNTFVVISKNKEVRNIDKLETFIDNFNNKKTDKLLFVIFASKNSE